MLAAAGADGSSSPSSFYVLPPTGDINAAWPRLIAKALNARQARRLRSQPSQVGLAIAGAVTNRVAAVAAGKRTIAFIARFL